MSDKFGANTISSISPDPKTTYPIVLGKSFFVDQNIDRPTGFVAATYRFKPSSVDQSKPGNISFDKTTATLQFERRTNLNNNMNKNKKQKIKFQGESKLATDREFFLWFDASSQKMVLERSGIQIKQLKHDREQNRPVATSYNDTSKDRMKIMCDKHKKKARKNKSSKNNNNNNNNTNNINKKKKLNNKMMKLKANNNNSDTSSTRSSSQSISPYHNQNGLNNLNLQNTQFRSNNNMNNNMNNLNSININNNHINNNNNINNSNNSNKPKPLFGNWDDDSDDSDD